VFVGTRIVNEREAKEDWWEIFKGENPLRFPKILESDLFQREKIFFQNVRSARITGVGCKQFQDFVVQKVSRCCKRRVANSRSNINRWL
jgi:hypothetical protein